MLRTMLERRLDYVGPDSKGIVWEHNSHVGDAMATEMSTRGELGPPRRQNAELPDTYPFGL